MSATLGEGGELERIIGVPKIEKIPVPVGWDKRGSGRRFFVFPDYKYRWNEYIEFVAEQVEKQNRTLILCPDRITAETVKYDLQNFGVHHRFLGSRDIEDSLEPFTLNDNTILLLTNRYDGIDLPGDTCRQLIIVGSLGSTNLQEQFLLTRLGLVFLLKDRIRTRFTQATGRCTRGATDYSIVMPLGRELFEYCLKLENRTEMHPELQAELTFGLDQIKDLELDDFSVPIEMFLNQTEDWRDAEEYITEERDSIKIVKDKRTEILNSVVKNEVNFQYSLWKKDFQKSLEYSRSIVDELSGNEFEGYRALWCYVAGSIGWILYKKLDDESYKMISKEFYEKSKNCSKIISWFSELPLLLESKGKEILDSDSISGYVVENIQRTLVSYGTTGPRFENTIKIIEEQIKSDEYKKFELGLTSLGEILGFNATHPEGKGVPDSVWQISNKLIILFEAKSEEKETNGIPIRTCREASGHYNWARTNLASYNDAKKICVVISRKEKLDVDAIPHAENLYYIHIDRIRKIFGEISGILRRIRSLSANFNEDSVRPKIIEELQRNKLDPVSIMEEFESIPLIKISNKIP
jgi:Rad3-related DNA helicases